VAGHPAAGGDDAGADPDVAVQVDDVVAAGRDAAAVLDQRGDVGVVADRQPAGVAQRGTEGGADRLFGRADGGGQPHRAVGPAGPADDGHPGADRTGVAGHLAAQFPDEAGQRRHGVEERHAARPAGLAAVQDAAAEADAGRAEPVHLDAQRVRVDLGRLGPDHQGRSPGPAGVAGHRLADQARGGEFGGQGADGAAVEPEAAGELRPGGGAVQVHVLQQGSEVAPAYLFRAGGGPHQRATPGSGTVFIGFR
jgi:hypothetical protein